MKLQKSLFGAAALAVLLALSAGTAGARPQSPAGVCRDCHGTARLAAPHPAHKSLASEDCHVCHSLAPGAKKPPVSGAEASGICADCHHGKRTAHLFADPAKRPLCTDCHSFVKDAMVVLSKREISARCAACHEKETSDFRMGGHAIGAAARAGDAPTCVDCHSAHDSLATRATLRTGATARCVNCHADEKLARKYHLPLYAAGSYLRDYHGATTAFRNAAGGAAHENVLICADCHGAHAVGWKSDRKVSDVCLTCHKKGDPKLAGAWLGHSRPSPRSAAIIWLIRLFYTVLIPFMLIGLSVVIGFQIVEQRRKGATVKSVLAKRAHEKAGPYVVRFRLRERVEHAFAMSTFITLTVTGLPQVKPALPVAQKLIALLGGIGMTRLIHRSAGAIFIGLLLVHATNAVTKAMRTRRMPVMAPRIQDFIDAFLTLRHFIWGTPRPKAGKFDFAEKFEYWGLFLGGTLMSVTGVALIFPEIVTHFLPGIFVAVFRTMHGLEATFAVLVVVLWHSYGVLLRPEIFPLDTSIFTGRIPLERLEEEHALEYERIFGEVPEQSAASAEAGEIEPERV